MAECEGIGALDNLAEFCVDFVLLRFQNLFQGGGGSRREYSRECSLPFISLGILAFSC